MLSSLRWLALEVKYLDRARDFYAAHLPTRRAGDREVALAAGETDLLLRRPDGIPRGGLHTHYALSTPAAAYDEWWDRLAASFDLVEHEFPAMRSLYFDDPDDHCVEIGGMGPGAGAGGPGTASDTDGSGTGGEGAGRAGDGPPPITGVFEVALEVEDIERATAFYRGLGFEPVDSGGDRRRVRLGGPVDLELWEPQLGIADARGGVHVDLGFGAPDPAAAADAVADRACARTAVDGGVRVRDPDGHVLTFEEA